MPPCVHACSDAMGIELRMHVCERIVRKFIVKYQSSWAFLLVREAAILLCMVHSWHLTDDLNKLINYLITYNIEICSPYFPVPLTPINIIIILFYPSCTCVIIRTITALNPCYYCCCCCYHQFLEYGARKWEILLCSIAFLYEINIHW